MTWVSQCYCLVNSACLRAAVGTRHDSVIKVWSRREDEMCCEKKGKMLGSNFLCKKLVA